ncbi:uncharacterized protein B0I36DRAFT_417035 [Microdochium trichocladiopsis]|uniref:Uncharacterized protein n=1 Tax=Microdochium trichocladiopsis TaxID=1682393 RepID=A0A9P8XXH4_9PEZI|nr:uncharacterized protein B0I36DRAFT_417035 [Microdochium trichocladiopsis]KAH7025049.1 hypothetical protein B0I36DRAFT_417035 [Microdochium trichocladiopsis]
MPTIRKQEEGTPVNIKAEDADEAWDSDARDDVAVHNLRLSPLRPAKRCHESSSPSSSVSSSGEDVIRPLQADGRAQATLMPASRALLAVENGTSTSAAAGLRSRSEGGRPSKRVRHESPRNAEPPIRDNDNANNLNDNRGGNHEAAAASPNTQDARPIPLDLNKCILRLNASTGFDVALAEFIASDMATSDLITRFSWAKFLDWHHTIERRGYNTGAVDAAYGRYETSDGSVVNDKYSWHVFLLEAQEAGHADSAGGSGPNF